MHGCLYPPWDFYVKRVIIHSADYLGFQGDGTAGGRQRVIRDIASIIRDHWKREVIIVQKSSRNFEKTCDAGLPVVGIKSNLTASGDSIFSYKARRLVTSQDAVLYASGEDAWPFFEPGSKAIQHGVWWDGPQSKVVQVIQTRRALDCMKKIRSMMCVDTNFINWLRCHGKTGLSLANKCIYVPNYADLLRLEVSPEKKTSVLRLLCARRYEEKRGIDLFVDSLAILNNQGVRFTAHISAPGGLSKVKSRVENLGLSSLITVSEDGMDAVLKRYGAADIAVVPTIWSEGTSLACVEAVCAGLPVVTTPVGGLGNLIIPGFNGYLVAPTAEAIAQAISAFKDRNLLLRMRSNCLSLREPLSMETWKNRVLDWLKN